MTLTKLSLLKQHSASFMVFPNGSAKPAIDWVFMLPLSDSDISGNFQSSVFILLMSHLALPPCVACSLISHLMLISSTAFCQGLTPFCALALRCTLSIFHKTKIPFVSLAIYQSYYLLCHSLCLIHHISLCASLILVEWCVQNLQEQPVFITNAFKTFHYQCLMIKVCFR